MPTDRRGNTNFFVIADGSSICAFTYPNGDYCGLPWDHESPCNDPLECNDDVVYGLREGTRNTTARIAREIREALAEHHHPKDDGPYSLVKSPYCACGAMHVYLDTDGHNSIGPVPYPCPTVTQIEDVLQRFEKRVF